MIKSLGKLIKEDYSDPISRRREVAARCSLRALRHQPSLESFVFTFSSVPLRVERKLRAGSLGFFTYFHLVYSAELFAVASERKLTHTLFRQVTELMVTIDREFVGNSTSPPFAFLSYHFDMGISFSLGKGLQRVLWST